MNTNVSAIQKALLFLEQSTTTCRRCKNFGMSSCPNFKKATEECGLDADVLKAVIEEDQKDVTTQPCSNAVNDV